MPVYGYLCQESIHQHEAGRKVACVACDSGNVGRRWSEVAVETSRKS